MATPSLQRVINHLRAEAHTEEEGGAPDGELLEIFILERDEAAFEALVRRHGPMVFGVCRRILRNDADAEDAFQATFLVLVHKANSIRPRGMVSNWLYGVAHNTALKARAMIQQRQRKEKEAGKMPKAGQREEAWQQMQSVVDAELSRLPDKYRVPIVLCDLEGKSIKEAVRHLGWPQGTVASRLTRGRALLARRLSKHGVLMSTGLLAGALSASAVSASVPVALTMATVQAGCLLAAGKAVAAVGASATALALADGMLKSMLLVKLKLATAVVLLAASLTAGIGVYSYSRSGAATESVTEMSAGSTVANSPGESVANMPSPPRVELCQKAPSHQDPGLDHPATAPAQPTVTPQQDLPSGGARSCAAPAKIYIIHSHDWHTIKNAAAGLSKNPKVQIHSYTMKVTPDGVKFILIRVLKNNQYSMSYRAITTGTRPAAIAGDPPMALTPVTPMEPFASPMGSDGLRYAP